MDNIPINMPSLISMVESSPGLWDRKSKLHSNRQATYDAWRNICGSLSDKFETMSEEEKVEFRLAVVKKWNNARDNWMKCYKRKTPKHGERVRKYKYFDQMSFLSKVVKFRSSDNVFASESVDGTDTFTNDGSDAQSDEDTQVVGYKIELESENAEDSDEQTDEKPITRKRRKELSVDKEQMLSLISSTENVDNGGRVMSFFRGIAPTIERFSDEDVVEFQYEVIKAMRNISRRSKGSHYVYLPSEK